MSKTTVKNALAVVVGSGLRYRDTKYIWNAQGRFVKERDERAIIDAVLEYVNALDAASKKRSGGRCATRQCDEKDLSKLFYLAEAIVQHPRDIDTIFSAITKSPRVGMKLSPVLYENLRELQSALKKLPKRATDATQRKLLVEVANNLLMKKQSTDAGRALLVALEQHETSAT